ncbi:MAG: AIPR family protein [Pontixanthobacter sp.]
MASNLLTLLDQKFDEEKPLLPTGLDLGQQFEIFSSNIIHRNLGWSYEEVQNGIVGGEKDGGIDAFYLLINGTLIQDEDDFLPLTSGIKIHLIFLQAKHEAATKEAVIDKFYQHIDDILSLTPDKQKLALHFNSDLLQKLKLYRAAIRRYGTKDFELAIDIAYASRGGAPTDEAQSLADKLVAKCHQQYPDARVNFQFYGVQRLHKLSIAAPKIKRVLKPIGGGTISAAHRSHVTLVPLKNYLKFICEDGDLLQQLFEFNVRDYEGDRKTVNAEMASTIDQYHEKEDFWWFNNGITIIAPEISVQSPELVIENPMIVNGLQTSNVIFEKRDVIEGNDDDERSLLVRVVQVSDPDIQERIIKATNSQTSLKPLALKATDAQQKDIEEYLRAKGIFYERRKNFYKNRGKPASSIIDVARLGQSVMAMRMQVPHEARGRPGTFLKNQDNYDKVFPVSINFDEYVNAAKLERKVDAFISKIRASTDAVYRNNLRYHLMMILVWELAGKKTGKIDALNVDKLDDAKMQKAFDWLIAQFDKDGAEDSTAKDKAFTESLKKNWSKQT